MCKLLKLNIRYTNRRHGRHAKKFTSACHSLPKSEIEFSEKASAAHWLIDWLIDEIPLYLSPSKILKCDECFILLSCKRRHIPFSALHSILLIELHDTITRPWIRAQNNVQYRETTTSLNVRQSAKQIPKVTKLSVKQALKENKVWTTQHTPDRTFYATLYPNS